MLRSIDTHWREHLAVLDQLRQGIHLRGYAQKNPKQEYKREAFELFSALLNTIKHEVTQVLMNIRIQSREEAQALADQHEQLEEVKFQHTDYETALAPDEPRGAPKPLPNRNVMKVGRNEPCPCGSGKKYKQCHGRLS